MAGTAEKAIADFIAGMTTEHGPDYVPKRERIAGFDRRDLVLFHEYFHGDTCHDCGASHQTGWTGLITQIVVGLGEHNSRADIVQVLRNICVLMRLSALSLLTMDSLLFLAHIWSRL
jgi:hypothetical protein